MTLNAPPPGSWVVVKYASKKEIYHYFIGQMLHSYEKGAEVKFLRNHCNNKFIWPPQDGFDNNVPFNNIVEVPEPNMVSSRGSGIFSFNADLSKYTKDERTTVHRSIVCIYNTLVILKLLTQAQHLF